MDLSVWNPLSHCASLIIEKKYRRESSGLKKESKEKPTLRKSQESRLREELHEASVNGFLVKSKDVDDEDDVMNSEGSVETSKTLARLLAQREFLQATAQAADRVFYFEDSIPSFQESFNKFLTMYPEFQSTEKIDHFRLNEYSHLSEVCLDYCGFGLFSFFQSIYCLDSSSFSLSEIKANLSNRALSSGIDEGTAEHDIKTRIMNYLNIPENDYGVVFTEDRGSAFKLLAEAYPFQSKKKLLTMFDHESQSVNWMAQNAKKKGAKVLGARFKWPTMKLCSAELGKQISNKRRRKDTSAGLFVFPVQSRVTGVKYSYQWMALAQQNCWHVLLDAGALGPKDMDSLGLSLFRPDFIITSFYRVFGYDPTGFGCLLIKKSIMGILDNKCGLEESGMVRIVRVPPYLGDSVDSLDRLAEMDDEVFDRDYKPNSKSQLGSQMPAFSGAYTSVQVQEVFASEVNNHDTPDRDMSRIAFEETEDFSVAEVMKSPIFSEDDLSDNSYWIDLCQSPCISDFSGQISEVGASKLLSASKYTTSRSQCRLSPPSKSSIFNDRTNSGPNEDYEISFDSGLSVSQELYCDRELPRRELYKRSLQANELKDSKNSHMKEIREESEIRENGLESSSEVKESSIMRETECQFRLLESRQGNKINGRKFSGLEKKERKFSTSADDNRGERPNHNVDLGEPSEITLDCYDASVSGNHDDWERREPEIICRHLDQVTMLGLNKISLRLRFLINWLVTSLLQLRLSDPEGDPGTHLVCIYGPKIKYERGASVAFNIKAFNGGFINPELVQRLAETHGISLGTCYLSHIWITDDEEKHHESIELTDASLCKVVTDVDRNKISLLRIKAVTASLGFLTNFEDVYKTWAFIAKFLKPSFVKVDGLCSIVEDIET